MGEAFRAQCEQIALRALAQRGWTLVQDERRFVAEVEAEAQARLPHARRPLEKIIEDAAINRYGYLWYAACREQATERQRAAFVELHRYLYTVALYCAGYDRQIADESAQSALVSVWRHLEQVRDPGSFVRWAQMIVMNEVKAAYRREKRRTETPEGGASIRPSRETPEAALVRQDEDGDPLNEVSTTPPPLDSLIVDEARTHVESAIRRCLRSRQQQAVIIGLFLDERSVKEVAGQLAITPQFVYVLKGRALKRLRHCTEFLEALEEWM